MATPLPFVRLMCMCLLATPVVAVDELLVHESFDSYSAPASIPASAAASTLSNGIGWKAGEGWHLTIAAPLGAGTVDSSSLTVSPAAGNVLRTLGTTTPPSEATIGGVGRVFSTRLTPSATDPIYILYILKGENLQGTAGSVVLNNNAVELHDSVWNSSPVVSLNTAGTRTTTPPNMIRWRLGSFNDSATVASPADDNAHLIVMRIDNATVRVWFDPSLTIEPSSGSAFTTQSISPLGFDRIRVTGQCASDGTVSRLRMDELRIGSSWAAVTATSLPRIDRWSPRGGSTFGGTDVAFEGAGLDSITAIAFGGVAGTNLVATMATVGVRTPAGTAGPNDVTVTHSTGTMRLISGFTYVAGTSSAPVIITPPSITGDVRPGGGAVADPGSWDPAQTSFTYVWQRADDTSGTNLATRGTGQSYFPDASDLGKYLRVRVTPSGTSSTADSAWVRCAYDKLSASQLAASDAAGPAGCSGGSGLALIGVLALLAARRRR